METSGSLGNDADQSPPEHQPGQWNVVSRLDPRHCCWASDRQLEARDMRTLASTRDAEVDRVNFWKREGSPHG